LTLTSPTHLIAPPRILLLQNHALVGERLRISLSSQPGWRVNGPVDSLHEARRLLTSDAPDLVLSDLSLRDGHLGQVLSAWREQGLLARTQVLVSVLSADDKRLMPTLRQGADAHLLHGSSTEQLTRAVNQVLAGESPLTPMIARQLRRYFIAAGWKVQGGGSPTRAAFSLTTAERLILGRASEGYSSDEISAEMSISPAHLGRKVRGLYRKFRFDTQGQRALMQAA
jgi:DNA-binding NarL/FixJ family response regulator